MARTGSAPKPHWRAHRVQASGSSILLALATIVAVVLILKLVGAASQPFGWVAAATCTALVLWPVVERLDVVLPRGIGIFLALVLTAALGVGLWLSVTEQLRGQFNALEHQLPAAARELEERDGEGGMLDQLRFGTLVSDVVDGASERIAPEPTVQDAAGTAPAFLASGILVVFFLIWGPKVLTGGLRQIDDDEIRAMVANVAGRAARLTQGYIIASVAIGVVAGAAAGVLAWKVGLPTPMVLGVLVGVASTVPYLGVLFGAIPLLLLATPTESALTVVALAAALVALQVAHTATFVALRRRRGLLRAGPAVIVVCAMVGSDAYGLGGALVAVVIGIFAVATLEAAEIPATVESVDAG